MHFYCYSKFGEKSHKSSLGEPDYSYYFVLKAYLPLLEKLGNVEIIDSLDKTVLNNLTPALDNNSDVFLFVFTPPHKIPDDLPGCVIPVFAWEYSSLPTAGLISDPKDCWRTKLLKYGQALTISQYAKNVVLDEIGPDFLIESIPAPISQGPGVMADKDAATELALSPDANIIDSRSFSFEPDSVTPKPHLTHPFCRQEELLGKGESLDIDLGSATPGALSIGFYPPEGWGAWSSADCCWVVLPRDIQGVIQVSISVRAHGKNIGRQVTLSLGSEHVSLVTQAEMTEHTFEVTLENRTNFISFQELDHSTPGKGEDTRCPGIGVSNIRITSAGESFSGEYSKPPPLLLDAPVYTSLFNPRDNRKNWEDILTAFCFAFREKADATLVLKMTCGDVDDFLDDLFQLLCQLQPFKCRVIAIQGYLSSAEFNSLRDNTKYIVNASHGEGQCLPLVEFMSQGTPAIAPQHTSLNDYINPDCAFIVSSAPEPTFWPHEPEQKLTTLWFRPNWESLRDAYIHSYNVLTTQPDEYSRMSLQATKSIQGYCSQNGLLEAMEQFLAKAAAIKATQP
jgi:Domain of unknown function (DUF7024)